MWDFIFYQTFISNYPKVIHFWCFFLETLKIFPWGAFLALGLVLDYVFGEILVKVNYKNGLLFKGRSLILGFFFFFSSNNLIDVIGECLLILLIKGEIF